MCLSLNLVCPATIVPYAADDGTYVTTGIGDGLAVVKRLDSGEELSVLLEEIGQLEQQAAPLVWCCQPPYTVEGLAGSSYGDVDVLLGGLGDLSDNLLSGGVDNLKLLLVNALDPLAIDIPSRGRV